MLVSPSYDNQHATNWIKWLSLQRAKLANFNIEQHISSKVKCSMFARTCWWCIWWWTTLSWVISTALEDVPPVPLSDTTFRCELPIVKYYIAIYVCHICSCNKTDQQDSEDECTILKRKCCRLYMQKYSSKSKNALQPCFITQNKSRTAMSSNSWWPWNAHFIKVTTMSYCSRSANLPQFMRF